MRHDTTSGSPDGEAARHPGEHGDVALSLHARVLDIGLAGLAIETDTRLIPQHSLGMRIGSATGELELSGHVVWCFFHGTAPAPTGEQQPVYRAGIEFSDVLTQRATDLLRFLEAHAVVTMETRLFGRFRLDEAGPVAIHSRGPFRLVSVRSDALEIDAALGLEPALGAQASIQLAGETESHLATVSELARTPGGERWRLLLHPHEPLPALFARARALLATT